MPDDIERVLTLLQDAEKVDGFPALNEASSLRLRHRTAGTRSVMDDGAEGLRGYGQLSKRGAVTEGALVVHPDHRRRGVGTRLLTEMLTQSENRLEIWAAHATPAAAALAARTGLLAVRELLTMLRPLTAPIESVNLPPDVVIRAFQPGRDEESWLAVNARAFADHHEQGGLTRVDLDQRISEPWFDPAGLLLATRSEGTVIGFHWTKQHAGSRGEVYVLGVDPDAGVRGVGRPLLTAGLQHLRAAGNTEVLVYTDATNARAVELYERAGFTVISRDIMYASRKAVGT